MRYYLIIVVVLVVGAYSCQKDDSKLPYGISKIYMPQAIQQSGGVNNQDPVPSGTDSSTYNYTLDAKDSQLDVILGASLSGPSAAAYTVGIQVDNDTIQQMLASGVFDTATYMLMPASMYTIPTSLTVPQGAGSGTFNVAVNIGALKAASLAGKYLLLAVSIVNPTTYSLDTALSTTIVVMNVNSLVIGPAVNITAQYVQNPGNPFVASSWDGTRWGTLVNWSVNPAAASHNGLGGYSYDGDGYTMDMESGWGSAQIYNGKVWQTVTLPAGTYGFDLSGGSWVWQGTLDPTYAVVAPGADSLPDYTNIKSNSAIDYQLIVNSPQPLVTWTLTGSTKVTLGVVIDYVQTEQGFKTSQVMLYNYPKHL